MIKGNDDISRKPYLGSIEIAQVYLGNTLVYPDGPTPPIDYSTRYLTFDILENGNIGFTMSTNTLQYSKNGGTTWSTANPDINIPVSNGDKVLVKFTNPVLYKENDTFSTTNGVCKFYTDCRFNVYGNVMSLIYGDDFQEHVSFQPMQDNYGNTVDMNHLLNLFFGCSKLISAENLVLPATILKDQCYSGMFQGCTSLTTAPNVLPAAYVTAFSYESMFSGCTSLTTAPVLSGRVMGRGSYQYMFQGCTSLTTAPALTAMSLAIDCYDHMFQGCTSLTAAPALTATTLAEGCYNGMFEGCTSLTTAPILPAQTLVKMCYYGMFEDCTNLNSITCFATSISASDCTTGWVQNVAATGTFTKEIGMSSWTTGDYGIPSGWTVDELVKMEITQASASGGLKTLINKITDTETGSTIVKQIIDGVQLPSASTTYNLSNGTHVIRYKFSNNIIGDAMFSNLDIKNLRIPSNITKIGKSAFERCSGLTSVTFPNGVTSIGQDAFYNCSGLTNVTITNVQTIGAYAFSNCGNLNNLNILGGLVEVKIGAFQNCTRLRWVELPDTVTAIRQEAFDNCTSLSEVYVYATTPPTLGSSAFRANASGRIIYVPSTSVNAYKAASGWSSYSSYINGF